MSKEHYGRSPIDAAVEQVESIVAEMAVSDVEPTEMKLPVDEGLEVVIESHEAGRYDESHAHTAPEQDVIVLHLEPPEAQIFDCLLDEFCKTEDVK